MSYKEYHGDIAKVCDQCGYIIQHIEDTETQRDILTGQLKFYVKSLKVESELRETLVQSYDKCDDCETYK
jgi:hypothetical protein